MTEILTTTAGSLPRTPELLAANAARRFDADGLTPLPSAEFDAALAAAVDSVVTRQQEIGITLPGDGEYGKAMTTTFNYGAWWSYIFHRTAGLEIVEEDTFVSQPPTAENADGLTLTSFGNRRDRQRFPDVYASDAEVNKATPKEGALTFPVASGELAYTGHEQIASDVSNFSRALKAQGIERGFLTSLSPGSGARIQDRHYGSEDAFLEAWAGALHEEYKAITDAGLIVQVDDPSIAENFDQIDPEPSIEDYLRFTGKRVEALNHALEGLPTEQLRFHLCWGSWHGPHTTDIEFKHLVKLMLDIDVTYYSFEGANARHEHEYVVWDDVTLPEDKIIVPGVVTHSTNVVEHPELVAQRIQRYAKRVGPERVIASTDCGLGGRIHPDIAWAKLESLAEGARIASQRA
ncbi:cobalamin-independent methionine synthase II family protein [Brachybacterium sp. GCM10030267]|uniref:cobalamin-independent methionine synthase II family protein n=1 Tax=Brachybacterium sp. GCM10030267 TaxID=3273381 RepID=UPI003618560E